MKNISNMYTQILCLLSGGGKVPFSSFCQSAWHSLTDFESSSSLQSSMKYHRLMLSFTWRVYPWRTNERKKGTSYNKPEFKCAIRNNNNNNEMNRKKAAKYVYTKFGVINYSGCESGFSPDDVTFKDTKGIKNARAQVHLFV